MDRIQHSSDPPQSSLHSTAEDCDCLLGGKSSGSGSQVGNNADDWCDSIVKDGTYVDHSFIERPSPLIVWRAGPMCHARLCLSDYGVDVA